MAWVKIPKENHPIFTTALPKDKRVKTVTMFGGIAALVNGHMFGGLFARSALVKVGEADYAEAMAIDGSEPFDPMGKGHVMANTVLLGEGVMEDPAELASWLAKAFAYNAALPPKAKKKPRPKPKKVTAAKGVAKKPVAKTRRR